MASHQAIVVELGSSRIKVGFAGEPRPRRVLFDDSAKREGGGWTVNVNDGMVSRACHWPSFFHYYSPSCTAAHGVNANGSVSLTTSHDWEKTLYSLFSHILTSILFIQRPSRHRILVLVNDTSPPRSFHEALHRVLLDYLSVGGVWLLNGGVFEGFYHLLEGMSMPPSLSSLEPPKAFAG